MTARSSLGRGTALLAVYVAVAVATAQWAPGRMRPLFDGFASHPGAYNWVKPPKEFAEGNRPPDSAQARIAFEGGASTPAQADPPDGQATASVPAGALPAHGSDGAATLDLRPVDPATLGPLPPGLRAEGNAYQVSISYLPSRDPATAITAPGRVGVMSDAASDTLLFSSDGRSWRPVDGQPIANQKGFLAPLTELGYFLAAGGGEPRALESGGGGVPVVLLVAAAGVPLILGYLLLGRRRTAAPAARSSGSPKAKPKPKPATAPKAKVAPKGPRPSGTKRKRR